MKVIVQRSKNASVTVNNEIVGKCDYGITLLVGLTHDDDNSKLEWMAKKVLNLRIFDDENGVMNKSLLDVGGSILSISQFTLYANSKKGNRPSYVDAMNPDKAVLLFKEFNNLLRKEVEVETGVFGAEMQVSFTNDGPVTIILEK